MAQCSSIAPKESLQDHDNCYKVFTDEDNEENIIDLLIKIIKKSSVDMRKPLCQSILITGPFSHLLSRDLFLKDSAERLLRSRANDISQLSNNLSLTHYNYASTLTSWIGASLLCGTRLFFPKLDKSSYLQGASIDWSIPTLPA